MSHLQFHLFQLQMCPWWWLFAFAIIHFVFQPSRHKHNKMYSRILHVVFIFLDACQSFSFSFCPREYMCVIGFCLFSSFNLQRLIHHFGISPELTVLSVIIASSSVTGFLGICRNSGVNYASLAEWLPLQLSPPNIPQSSPSTRLSFPFLSVPWLLLLLLIFIPFPFFSPCLL